MRPLIGGSGLAFASVVLVACGAGCGTSRVHLEADGGEGRLAPAARYALSAEGSVEASVVVEAEGLRDDDVDGRTADTARFRIAVSNPSASALQIPLGTIVARDDRGRTLRRAALFAGPSVQGDVFVVGGGRSDSFELLYDLGGRDQWDTTGSVVLDWGYEFRGAAKSHQTRFLPVRYVTRYYERPAFVGFGFGYRRYCR